MNVLRKILYLKEKEETRATMCAVGADIKLNVGVEAIWVLKLRPKIR